MHRHGSYPCYKPAGLRLGRRRADGIDHRGIAGQRALGSLGRDPGEVCPQLLLRSAGSPDSALTPLLSSPASPSRAQLEVHVSGSLTKLQAVEGAEVVLSAWYSLHGELSPTKPKPWEVPTVMWFFLEGKDKNMSQVRERLGRRLATYSRRGWGVQSGRGLGGGSREGWGSGLGRAGNGGRGGQVC